MPDQCPCWCIHIWLGQGVTEVREEDINKEKLPFHVVPPHIWIKPLKLLDICQRLSYSRSNSCYNYLQGEVLMEGFYKWAQMLQTATCCHISRTTVKTELCTVVCNREHLAPKTQKRPHQQNLWILWQWAATLAESPFRLNHGTGFHPSRRLSKLVRRNPEMFLVLVCVITMIAVMMIMHPFCPWNERWNNLMEVCVFLFGTVTRRPTLLDLSGKDPRLLHKFGSVLKMTESLFQDDSRGNLKKSQFRLVQWAQWPALLRICTGSAGDH